MERVVSNTERGGREGGATGHRKREKGRGMEGGIEGENERKEEGGERIISVLSLHP